MAEEWFSRGIYYSLSTGWCNKSAELAMIDCPVKNLNKLSTTGNLDDRVMHGRSQESSRLHSSAIFEAATLDDVLASYTRGYRGQATPTANRTIFKLVFCALFVITIALMKTAARLSKLWARITLIVNRFSQNASVPEAHTYNTFLICSERDAGVHGIRIL